MGQDSGDTRRFRNKTVPFVMTNDKIAQTALNLASICENNKAGLSSVLEKLNAPDYLTADRLIQGLKTFPAHLKKQEALEKKIAEHPASILQRMNTSDIKQLFFLLTRDDEQIIKEKFRFVYEEEADRFKLVFWVHRAGFFSYTRLLIFYVERNLDFKLCDISSGYNPLHVPNQIAVRALINKYI